jgi:hypothetical protein
MNRADLQQLREPREYPAVSLLMPLQRHRPGNPDDPVRLRHLVDQARRRLREEFGARASAAVLQHLDDGVASIDMRNPTDGAAIFATATETRVLALPFSVPERVVIDNAFDTRDLARGLARSPRYRVLALAEKPARLLEGAGSTLVEVRGGGFPMFVEGAHGEPLASGGYAPHSSRSEEQHRQFFRQIDRAFGEHAAADPLPIVLAGTERDLAYFEEVTEHGASIVGRFQGNHELTPTEELSRLAEPSVADHLAAQRAAAVSDLVEAIGTGHAVVGIKPVWERAVEGRGRVLLIEEGFEYPARVVDRRLEPAGDPDAPDVLDDAVDVLVDIVLESGGDALFLQPGALGSHGPVAMLLRY